MAGTYQMGFKDGVMDESSRAHDREEDLKKFLMSLLEIRTARSIHSAIRNRLS